jgi:hypothetical protein
MAFQLPEAREFREQKINESRSDHWKLASYEVAGISADKIIRPSGTMENTRPIPPSLQDGFILQQYSRHDVPG